MAPVRLDQIQSEMSLPSLAAGAGGDAGAGILGWSGRLSGVGRTGVTSLAGTWGRSSAVGMSAGVPLGGGGAGPDHVQQG